MKPRTKIQRRVYDLSLKVPSITKVQKEWALNTCLKHKGFANKTNAFCLDCGDTFSHEIINRKRAECPSCNTKLKIDYNRKSTDNQNNYFAIAEIVEEFQVIRHFEIKASYKKGQPVKYHIMAILEDWIMPDLKFVKVGRLHNTQGYCDSWGGDWSIRTDKRSWYSKYDVYPRFYYPKSNFKKEYKKHGINYNLKGLSFLEAIKIVPNNPRIETLLKAKQYGLIVKGNSYEIRKYWPSIKICLRNKYKVKDAGIWIDYLELLKYFRKDIRNAHYVCPKNLKKEHDRLVEKKRKIREAESLRLKKERVIKEQKDYLNQKGKYFNLVFSKGNLVIQVLKHVNEFVSEGDKLKHCLFANNYHSKLDSLILKATVNGESVETIEVCLKSFKILQSRGKHNSETEYNDDIRALMRINMNSIKALTRKKRTKVKPLKSVSYAEAI